MSDASKGRLFRGKVVELARKLQVTPFQMREAFCILSHCACSETPPPIPMVRAQLQDAHTEEIMSGVFRGEVKVEAFGRNRDAILAFYGWLEGYLPDFEERAQADARQGIPDASDEDTPTQSSFTQDP